jgi:hypothetical protein
LPADADVAVFRGNVHVAHHHQRLLVAELAFQQVLQVAVETLFGGKLGGMVAAFALGEIAIHDGDRHAIGVGEGAPDKAALSVFFIGDETLVQRQRCLA